MRILAIVGARPNMMKVAPVHRALLDAGHEALLIHTGQHYDANMSKVFFDDLGMQQPDENLEVGSQSDAVQIARIMEPFADVVLRRRPEIVLVAGDVNSTVACALVAAKLHVPVAHLEAGLRSGDRGMPEELNRIVTDHLSDLCLTPSADADANLRREGFAQERMVRVGNAMIDSLVRHLPRARAAGAPARLGLAHRGYGLVTLHRPSNVDDDATLYMLFDVFRRLAARAPLVFPVHPRTRARLDALGLSAKGTDLTLMDPLGYLDFLGLQDGAAVILTDSGGIQEESTALGVPCLTLRESTERPITITEGTNILVGIDPDRIVAEAERVFDGNGKTGRVPDLWDGHTAARVVDALERWHRRASESPASAEQSRGADARPALLREGWVPAV